MLTIGLSSRRIDMRILMDMLHLRKRLRSVYIGANNYETKPLSFHRSISDISVNGFPCAQQKKKKSSLFGYLFLNIGAQVQQAPYAALRHIRAPHARIYYSI